MKHQEIRRVSGKYGVEIINTFKSADDSIEAATERQVNDDDFPAVRL